MRSLTKTAVSALLLCLGVAAAAKDKKPALLPTFIVKAQYVFVEADSPFSGPTNDEAVLTVQDALRKWGKYRISMRPQKAGFLIRVQPAKDYARSAKAVANPGEDQIMIYGVGDPAYSPIWRISAVGGLQKPDPLLIQKFRADVERAEQALKEQEQQKKKP